MAPLHAEELTNPRLGDLAPEPRMRMGRPLRILPQVPDDPVEEPQVSPPECADNTVRHPRKIQGAAHIKRLVVALELVELASRHRKFRL